MLKWTPTDFWDCTPRELTNAYVGYCRREGIGRWEADQAGFNFETAAQMQRTMETMKKRTGTATKMDNVTKEERLSYKASRRKLREQGKLGGRYTN